MNIRTFETLPFEEPRDPPIEAPPREKKACFIIPKFFVDSSFKNCEHTDGLHLRNRVDVICDFCLNIFIFRDTWILCKPANVSIRHVKTFCEIIY